MPTKSTYTRIDDQRKGHLMQKYRNERKRYEQLQTHKLPTDDVENINSINKGSDLLLANKPRFVP